ncbi:MAG: SUMF1/EgtB/PvdO family nonheme iron enzyme, partial [Myxococcota bacterium]
AVDEAGNPYVLDWAGLVAYDGTFSGTPEFAAPERLGGGPPTAAADVFALAALAWEILAGRPLRRWPEGLSPGETIAHLLRADLPDVAPPEIDPVIGQLLLCAASADPAERPPASALASAIDDVLTGRASRARRRREALERLTSARREWLAFGERERRLEEERRVAAVQRARIPPHAPAAAKVGLWASEARAEQLLEEQSHAWTRTTELAMAAILLQPDLDDAHALLAEVWYERLRLSEAHDTPGERQLILDRIRSHDRGRFGELFEGRAELSVSGTGDAAIYEVVSDGRRRRETLRHEVTLPLERRELSAGSWIVELPRADADAVRVPVALQRVQHVQVVGEGPASDPEGFVYVPPGQFRMGGDRRARGPVDPCAPWLPGLWASRTCVTSAAYLAFLATLDPEEASRRAPGERLVTGATVPLWHRSEAGWQLPEGWPGDWPVVGVSLDDATAYAQWSGAERALALRLPTEDEWEKFARGADGRAFPWGEAFDACWCHMRDSLPGGPRLGPVSAFPDDRSPYGVHDVAGGVHEWTTSILTEDRHVIRGGSWASDAQACRLASRAGVPADSRLPTVGFRLVASAP